MARGVPIEPRLGRKPREIQVAGLELVADLVIVLRLDLDPKAHLEPGGLL